MAIAAILMMFLIPAQVGAARRFISFDYPGAIDTEAASITPGSDIVGRYTINDGMVHGFLRSQGQFSSMTFRALLSRLQPGSIQMA